MPIFPCQNLIVFTEMPFIFYVQVIILETLFSITNPITKKSSRYLWAIYSEMCPVLNFVGSSIQKQTIACPCMLNKQIFFVSILSLFQPLEDCSTNFYLLIQRICPTKAHSLCKQCLHDLHFLKKGSFSPNISKLARADILWKQNPCAELFTQWMDFTILATVLDSAEVSTAQNSCC